jgi:hypothetical protein
MTPVISDLGDAAPGLNRFILALGPFSRQSVPALESLGDAVEIGGPALVDTEPLLDDLRDFGVDANPVSRNLSKLLTSFDDTGGIERLMDYIFFQVTSINGFDSLSHYLRAGLIAAPSCLQYATQVAFGCESTFGEAKVAGASGESASGRIKAQIADRPPESAPPIERDLGDRVREILSLANPQIAEQREAGIERIQGAAEHGPGDPEPFLDYMLGNDR